MTIDNQPSPAPTSSSDHVPVSPRHAKRTVGEIESTA